MSYPSKPEDLTQDTKDFMKTEYGQYVMQTLQEKLTGHLSRAADVEHPHPERYAAKFSAVKEVIEFLLQPLDDNTPTHG